MNDESVTVYGTSWCPEVAIARRTLDALGVSYVYRDIDADKKAQKVVRRAQRGGRKVPTVTTPAGAVLVEPSPAELRTALGID